MKKIAIIPARGGSKRIPGKNIRDFCGKPIIAYSIEAALNSSLFDEVMVSTDSSEIKSIAEKYGAKVPFLRSLENSNDFATTADVVEEVLCWYKDNYNIFCCIYPTAPFVTDKLLLKSFIKIEGSSSSVDAVIPVVKFSYPPQRALVKRSDLMFYQFPENVDKRSQDLETIYHDAGQFYWGRVSKFLKSKTLVPGKTCGFILSELEVQDIDSELDWELAELKFNLLNKKLTHLA